MPTNQCFTDNENLLRRVMVVPENSYVNKINCSDKYNCGQFNLFDRAKSIAGQKPNGKGIGGEMLDFKNSCKSTQANCNDKIGKKPVGKGIKPMNTLNCCLWNARSLRHKTNLVTDYRCENDIDLFLFTESWLKHDDHAAIGELVNGGECSFLHNPRENRLGGGLAV